MYPIVRREKLADKIYLMDVKAPRVAQYCEPGQFVIVKIDEEGERIPLTICDYDREAGYDHDRIPDCRSIYRAYGIFTGRRCIPGFCRPAWMCV